MNFTKKYLWLVVSLSSFTCGSANADNTWKQIENVVDKTAKDAGNTLNNAVKLPNNYNGKPAHDIQESQINALKAEEQVVERTFNTLEQNVKKAEQETNNQSL